DIPAPGGYTITFSTGEPITISNGEKGDNGEPGDTPQIGVAEYPANSGVYYWTLNGVFIEIEGQKLPVTGPKGEDGTPGIPGDPGAPGPQGAAGATPKLRIHAATGYWQICTSGACDITADEGWTDVPGSDGNPVKATGNDGAPGAPGATGPQGDAIFAANGVDNSHPDYVEFTLAGGAKIRVPKYKAIAIHFTQPEKFDAGAAQTVPYTLTGSVEHVEVISLTPDWTLTHTRTGNAGTFTITAPATFTLDNEAGKAVLLISDGAERTVVRTIALVSVDYVSTDKGVIVAETTGGDYPVLLASNTSWTAAVSAEGAGWCTVTPTSGTGRGTLTVTVAAKTPEAPGRFATVTIAAGTLTHTVDVRQAPVEEMPLYAASAQTWTFGASTLVWSDAIQIPECNKDTYTNSSTEPQCRSYTSGTNTWYYYNWPYVNQHAAQLCPSPWRVPALSDFATLVESVMTSVSELSSEWGFGGRAESSLILYDPYYAYYWSAAEIGPAEAYGLSYSSTELGVYTNKYLGFQVRCVK
ncbi:MAG: hypothetical protein LBN98_05165, partial [Prevotellaceae bacterium]|nr:hypothetical protein [Prevotellaceae bacterium]